MNTNLLPLLAKNWWILLLRGLCGIAFGVLAFVWPGITLLTLILLYGAFVLAEGILELIAAFRGGTVAPRWWLVIAGLVALCAAAVTFLLPGMTALILLYIIGAWAIVHGVFEVIGAIRLRKEIDNEWMLIISGILSVLFGIVVFVWPGASAISLVWLIGAYAIALGAVFVGFSFRLRKHQMA